MTKVSLYFNNMTYLAFIIIFYFTCKSATYKLYYLLFFLEKKNVYRY